MCRRTHSEKLVAGGTRSGTQASGKPALQLRQVIGPIVQRLNCGVLQLDGIEQLHELLNKLLPGVIAQRKLKRSDDCCVRDLRANAIVKTPNFQPLTHVCFVTVTMM